MPLLLHEKCRCSKIKGATTFSITTLSIMTLYMEYCSAECNLCMSFMLSVTNKFFMLNVFILSAVILSVVKPN
jgi:hypothetical protein